jgi:tetratricopeptide (TPR) repeat protein
MAQPRAAYQYLSTAAALDPFGATTHALTCMALTDLGRLEEAAEECERARSLEPDSQSALTASSGVEEARGDAAGALKWTTIAIHGSNDVAELHADRGRWLMRLGLVKEAHDAYEMAVAATGEAARKNPGLAGLGLRSTFAVEGVAGVHRLIATNRMDATDDPVMMFWLAEAAQLTGDAGAAREYVRRALASSKMPPEKLANPWDARNGRSYLILAAAAERATGDEKLAEQHLAAAQEIIDGAVKGGMRRHDIYLMRAEIAALRGDANAAMQSLTTAAELGWRYVWLAKHLPYFQSIRERPDFKALVARIEARNAVDGSAILALLSPKTPR